MTRLRSLHRHPRSLAVDAFFFLWLGYVVVSGHIVPAALVDLIRNQPAASVISDPAVTPADDPIAVNDELPEAVARALRLIAV